MKHKDGKKNRTSCGCGIIRHTLKDDRGAALFVVVVIVLVLTVLCLSLIVAAGSLYNSSKNGMIKFQTQEVAVSISKELEKEITKPKYTSYAAESADRSAGKNALWFYLRDNIKNDVNVWPYFAEDGNKQNIETAGHGAAEGFRYFDLESAGLSDSPLNAGVSVCMYWTPAGKTDSEDNYDTSPSGRLLFVTVVSERDGGMYTVTSVYKLRLASDYTDETDDLKKQSWSWELIERR